MAENVPWYSPARWFLSSDDLEAGKAADRKLEELNRQAWQEGRITTEEYARRQEAIQNNSSDQYLLQVDGAFKEGWREGEQTVGTVIKDTVAGVAGVAGSVVAAPVKGIVAGLPWWLWLLGGLAVLVYLGALPRILAELRKL
jgi:hypothetical protein